MTQTETERYCPVCGAQYSANVTRLRFGRQTTCSRTCSYKLRGQRQQQDLTGKRFGRWVVIKLGKRTSKQDSGKYWLCHCDCGIEKEVYHSSLQRGVSQSCGCVNYENNRKPARQSVEHRIWKGMLARCANPNIYGYQYYGGRGIRVCERWKSFDNFYQDMGPRPSVKYSIERIDNNGPYSPENCKWATHLEQMSNRSNCHKIEYQGKIMTAAGWSRETGIHQATIRLRLWRGWPLDRVFSPTNKH